MSRVAIHGFGRIGHSLMKAALDGDVFVPVSISEVSMSLIDSTTDAGPSRSGQSASPKGSPRLVIRSAPSKTFTDLQAQSVKNRRFRKDHRT